MLYLIRKQNINILDIPVAEITRQYMGYVELMQSVRLELAAEYLVMAAMLAEIKSRMLLPRSAEIEAEEDDPRAELIRRLQEYERFKAAAEGIDGLSRVGRDVVVPKLDAPRRGRASCCRKSGSASCCCPWPRFCAVATCLKAIRSAARHCRPASA